MLKSISSLVVLAILAVLGGCATAPSGDRAGMYGAAGAVAGSVIGGKSRLAPLLTVGGALLGYEYGDGLDKRAAAVGSSRCTTSNSGHLSQDGKATQVEGWYQCNGVQDNIGIQTKPTMPQRGK